MFADLTELPPINCNGVVGARPEQPILPIKTQEYTSTLADFSSGDTTANLLDDCQPILRGNECLSLADAEKLIKIKRASFFGTVANRVTGTVTDGVTGNEWIAP